MEDDDPGGMAERYAEMARVNFERDGELAPILAIHGRERAAICLMKGSEDMPLAYGRTVSLAATIINPIYVITVTEVWMKEYKAVSEEDGRREADRVKRGDLGKMAEAGDETVRTALMTIAWTMDPTKAVAVIDKVLDDKTYDRNTSIGEQEGYMIECVIGGWKHGLTLPPPPFDLSAVQAASVLGIGGDVVGVLMEAV